MIRTRDSLIFGAFLLLTGIQPIGAQIRGRVTDPLGWPVPSARVELVGDSETLSIAMTDTLGNFDLTAHPEGRTVHVTALGMAPVDVPLGDLLHPMAIVLAPNPLELPPIEAVATPFRCPEDDEGPAREAWNRAMVHYTPLGGDHHSFAEVIQTKRGVTWPEDFGELELVPYVWSEVGGGAGGRWGPKTIQENGYALLQTWSSLEGRYDSWEYLSLDLAGSYYLALPWFAELQKFGIVQSGDDGVTLVFCDQRRRGSSIAGRAYVDSEGWVRKVEWRFETPEPREEAGGEAYFAAGAEYLLPESSAFWRKTPMGKYFQEARTFSPWFVGDREGVRATRHERIQRRGMGG